MSPGTQDRWSFVTTPSLSVALSAGHVIKAPSLIPARYVYLVKAGHPHLTFTLARFRMHALNGTVSCSRSEVVAASSRIKSYRLPYGNAYKKGLVPIWLRHKGTE